NRETQQFRQTSTNLMKKKHKYHITGKARIHTRIFTGNDASKKSQNRPNCITNHPREQQSISSPRPLSNTNHDHTLGISENAMHDPMVCDDPSALNAQFKITKSMVLKKPPSSHASRAQSGDLIMTLHHAGSTKSTCHKINNLLAPT
ncbi:hypothetical protein Salat_1170300, partial [Sesamum alatum]